MAVKKKSVAPKKEKKKKPAIDIDAELSVEKRERVSMMSMCVTPEALQIFYEAGLPLGASSL